MSLNSQLATSAVAVTPSDTTRFNASAIFAGGAGTVVIEPMNNQGTFVTFTVPAGGYVLCQCTQVRAASTATGLVRLA
jgi:hypothetical protein